MTGQVTLTIDITPFDLQVLGHMVSAKGRLDQQAIGGAFLEDVELEFREPTEEELVNFCRNAISTAFGNEAFRQEGRMIAFGRQEKARREGRS